MEKNMKKTILSQNIITKMVVVLIAAAVIAASIPISAMADNREDLLGVWRGTFRNRAGQHGIEMVVFRDNTGNFSAMTWLFPVAGGPQSFAGGQHYRSDVIFNNMSGRFETHNSAWVVGSGGLAIKTLSLSGDNLTGYMISSATGEHLTQFSYEFARIPRSNFNLTVAHSCIETAQPLHVEEPTCYMEGLTVYGCIFCDLEIVHNPPALPHTPSGNWVERSAPTCTAPGQRVQYCATCADEVVLSEEIPQVPHTPGEHWIVLSEPTANADGVEVLLCSYCDFEIERAALTLTDFEDTGGARRADRADRTAAAGATDTAGAAGAAGRTGIDAANGGAGGGLFGTYVDVGNTEVPLIVVVIIAIALMLTAVLAIALSRKGKKKQPAHMPHAPGRQAHIQHAPGQQYPGQYAPGQAPGQAPRPHAPGHHSMPTQPHTDTQPIFHNTMRENSPETIVQDHANHTIVQTAFCGKCGNQIQGNSGFCGICGNKI